MADIHRKIELQEQEDLCYLVNNVRRAADEKVNLALPPIEGEDMLRPRVESLVHDYITTTFMTAASNILINGHSPEPGLLQSLLSNSIKSISSAYRTEDYEPLNSKLHARAAELKRQEEDLLMEIAALRQEAPLKVREMWGEQWKQDEEGLKQALEAGERRSHGVTRGGADIQLGVSKLERQEEVEKTWTKGVEGLGRLKRELPGTVAKMERAKRAGGYVLHEK